jgi:hypothetical protein
MKKMLNNLVSFLKKLSKKVFTRKILLTVFLPIVVLLVLYLSRSLIIAAWVNGRPVFRYSVTRELEKQGGKQVLAGLIEKSLVASEAKKNNITVSQSDIDAQIKSIETTVTAQGVSLDEALSLRGMTRADLTDQIKTQIIVEKILSPKITITDQEVKDYFTTNKSLFGQNPVFETVKDQVKAQVFQQKLSTEYNTWITDLKAKAKILYFVNL